MVAALLSLVTLLALTGCSGGGTPCAGDAVTSRSLAELDSFTGWVRRSGVQAAIGEVGWPQGPDAPRWDALAKRWYAAADEAQLGVFAWSAAERWPADYPLGIYREAATPQPVPSYVAGSQAAVVERHLSQGGARGVSLADGSFGATFDDDDKNGAGARAYSNRSPGTYGVDYLYPSADFLRFVAGRGIRSVRLAFTWERLQPVLGGPLDPVELGRLRATVAAAATAGLSVDLDLHNYGRFAQGLPGGKRRMLLLGSEELPASSLSDVWTRLATAFNGNTAVSGYGLMNEPHDLPGGAAGWEAASTAAAVAIRRVDTRTPLYVGGYAHSGVSTWVQEHPRPWIDPALWPVVYEAHQYFDANHEGAYSQSYAKVDSSLPRSCATGQ